MVSVRCNYFAVVIAVLFAVIAAADGVPTVDARVPWLKYMSFYGIDFEAQQGIVNLGLEGSMQSKLDGWNKYKIPSFYGGVTDVFERGVGLLPGWEAALESQVNTSVLPYLGGAIRGVFLGDELCCSNITCWDVAYPPVTAKLRSLIGPDALIYTNECAEKDLKEIPADFDLISVDTYAGYAPGTKGEDEVTKAKAIFDIIFQKLHPGQKVMVVPGAFACSNLTYFPLADQDTNVAAKLQAYFDWAKADDRIAGINPWHFNNRSSPQHGPPCDMEIGVVALPKSMAVLKQIGQYIGPLQ